MEYLSSALTITQNSIYFSINAMKIENFNSYWQFDLEYRQIVVLLFIKCIIMQVNFYILFKNFGTRNSTYLYSLLQKSRYVAVAINLVLQDTRDLDTG